MGNKSKIEWTEATWNPVRGCSMAPGSEDGGCLNCYAARMAARGLPGMRFSDGSPLAVMRDSGPRWTGRVELQEHMLDIPLRRKTPTTYFVNSMSDLFHEDLPDEAIDRIFAVMALCPQHTFQVLTKRAKRMQEYFGGTVCLDRAVAIKGAAQEYGLARMVAADYMPWPYRNVWLGVSCENQATTDARIPLLLQTPAAVRFVSAEPLLGPVDLTRIGGNCEAWLNALDGKWRAIFKTETQALTVRIDLDTCPHLDWVIVGGESGPDARFMRADWARTIRDQCVAVGVPYFFKQWGEYLPAGQDGALFPDRKIAGGHQILNAHNSHSVRVGKTLAGALLDGREWRETPAVRK